MSKYCPDCGEEKPLDQFSKNKCTKDGLNVYCHTHANARTKASRSQNVEHYRERNRAWSKAHPENNRAANKRWRTAHPEYKANRRRPVHHVDRNAVRLAAGLSWSQWRGLPEGERQAYMDAAWLELELATIGTEGVTA